MEKTICDIHHDYWDGVYSAKAIPHTENHMLKEDYVFDEDLSVRENRRMVTEHNAKLTERRNQFHAQQNLLHSKMRQDLVDAIVGEYHLSNSQALTVIRRADEAYSTGENEWFELIEEEASFAYDILHA